MLNIEATHEEFAEFAMQRIAQLEREIVMAQLKSAKLEAIVTRGMSNEVFTTSEAGGGESGPSETGPVQQTFDETHEH